MKEKVTGPDMELIFNGFEGSVGHTIDINAQFVSTEGTTFTIKLDDDEYEKLKDIRPGTNVKVSLK